jgi:hypothetical protein
MVQTGLFQWVIILCKSTSVQVVTHWVNWVLEIKSQLLYQLSYRGKKVTGFGACGREPGASGTSVYSDTAARKGKIFSGA